MRTADSLWQAKIVKNNAKNQSHHMRTNPQNEIMKEEQLPQKETRKLCCLDHQSEYFQLSRTKTGGNGRRGDGESRYIQVIKK